MFAGCCGNRTPIGAVPRPQQSAVEEGAIPADAAGDARCLVLAVCLALTVSGSKPGEDGSMQSKNISSGGMDRSIIFGATISSGLYRELERAGIERAFARCRLLARQIEDTLSTISPVRGHRKMQQRRQPAVSPRAQPAGARDPDPARRRLQAVRAVPASHSAWAWPAYLNLRRG